MNQLERVLVDSTIIGWACLLFWAIIDWHSRGGYEPVDVYVSRLFDQCVMIWENRK